MKRILSGAALAAALVVALPVVGLAEDGRYIVKFNAGRSASGRAALRAAGARVVLSLDPQNAVAARIPEQALQGLQHNANIEYIEVDAIREPMATWNDVVVNGETVPFGVQMVQADLISSPNPGNRTVCIIDSGYSQQHEDLQDTGVTANTTDAGSGTWNNDSCGHGSHVAGTISAISGNATGVVGVTPGVALHIVKVFGDDNLVDGGNCAWTYSSTLVNALNKCQAAGANVVSMSLGGSLKSHTEDVAFSNAYTFGILSIAAAGNAGNRTTSYPAGYSSVVSVAAVDANEVVATFSQQNRDVEIAAPGVAVLSTVPWLDTNTLTATSTWSGGRIEGAARSAATPGLLIDGGQCTAAGPWTAQVVLCQRGTNSFNEKVTNVKNGGGVAAVIYNNVASDPTCGVFTGTLGDGVTSTIPAISLSCADGASALADAGLGGTVTSTFTAPGSGYEAWSGTSMATPHVSGVAALIWSCDPSKTNVEIRNAIDGTAKDLGAPGKDNAYGNGLVQAKAALQSLGLGACTVQ
jgi:subtilisin family serine protease